MNTLTSTAIKKCINYKLKFVVMYNYSDEYKKKKTIYLNFCTFNVALMKKSIL